MNTLVSDPTHRHDFVLVFDVQDGNPNGDPDAGNLPRIDPETMQGLVTDVCLKRKVRDFVTLTCSDQEGMDIYVQHRGVLNRQQRRAYEEQDPPLPLKKDRKRSDPAHVAKARKWMCDHFFDVRTFGAVMTTGEVGENCGQVRGPVQLTFARSVDPIVPLDLSITRVAVTKESDAAVSEDGPSGKDQEMGRKAMLPYGLYRGYGFVSPAGARDTGLSDQDLSVFWSALQRMWEVDRSASRGFMACRGLYVFTHDDPVGNAPAHVLFDRVAIRAKAADGAPRTFGDYEVNIDDSDMPGGVTLTRIMG